MRAAVVGGSLGGLTAALLLRELGVEVDVYERSPSELVQRGAGIGFLPDSARYLVERADVPLDRISVATSHIRYLNRGGEVIYDGLHRYRFSSWNTVYRELLACIDPAQYHLGHEMTGNALPGNAQGKTLSKSLGSYEQLDADRKFAEAAYQHSLEGLDRARDNADRQHIFIASFVPPSLPETALYPRRWRSLAVVALIAFALWGIGVLAVQSIRDHL